MSDTIVYEGELSPDKTVPEKTLSILLAPDGLCFAAGSGNRVTVRKRTMPSAPDKFIPTGEYMDIRVLAVGEKALMAPTGLCSAEDVPGLFRTSGLELTGAEAFMMRKTTEDLCCFFVVPKEWRESSAEYDFFHPLERLVAETGENTLRMDFNGGSLVMVLHAGGTLKLAEVLPCEDPLFPLLALSRLFQRFKLPEDFLVVYSGTDGESKTELVRRFPGFIALPHGKYYLLTRLLL